MRVSCLGNMVLLQCHLLDVLDEGEDLGGLRRGMHVVHFHFQFHFHTVRYQDRRKAKTAASAESRKDPAGGQL